MMISRREFLAAATLPSLSVMAPVLGATADHSTGSGSPAAKCLLIGTSIEPGMFKNLVRSLDSFQSIAGYAYPAILDVNGYPTATPKYNIFGRVGLPSKIKASDQMVFKFSGTGAIQLGRGAPGFRVLSGSGFVSGGTDFNLNLVGTNARVVFTFGVSVPEAVILSFLGGGRFAGLANVVLCRLVDEAAVDGAKTPEDMFDDDYVAVYQSLKLGVLRPMGWANPNFGNVSQARYIAPWQTSMNLGSQRWAPGAWAGSASGTNTYACAAQPDAGTSYVDGEMIHVQFTNRNTSAEVTLNSGGRGAVSILNWGAGSLAVGDITANSLATLTYDAVLKAFLWQRDGQTACIPFELQIAFANRINAHYWCTLPSYFDDASITAVATMVRDQLSPSLKAYFEYANEVWNWSFPATSWAAARGAALGFPKDNNRQVYGWYALRFCKAMDLVAKAWAPRPTGQLRRVIAFQAYGPLSGTVKYRFEGADLSGRAYPNYAGNGLPDYNAAPNRPIDVCDVLSYATYYSGAQCTSVDANYVSRGSSEIAGLLRAADDYATGLPAKMISALNFLDNDVRAGRLANGTLGYETLLALKSALGGTGIYPAWNAVAQQFGKSVECYEGGFQSWYPSTQTCSLMRISTSYGGPNGKIAALLNGYKMSEQFEDLVRDQWADFMALPTSRTPAWLIIPGPNQWALSTRDSYAPKYKSWDAAVALGDQ